MHGYSGTRRGEKMDPEATSKAPCPRCNREGYLTLAGVARPDVPCGACRPGEQCTCPGGDVSRGPDGCPAHGVGAYYRRCHEHQEAAFPRVEAARTVVADMRQRGDTGSLDYARALTELWKAEKAWQEAGDTGD